MKNVLLRIAVSGFLTVISFCLLFADEKFDNMIQLGNYQMAIDYAQKNLPPNTRTVDVWLGLATAYIKTSAAKDKILECFDNALKADPKDYRPDLAAGKYFLEIKDFTSAVDRFRKSYLIKRTSVSAEGMAIAAAKLEQWEKARDAAESAVHLDSSVVESRLILCQIYLKEKDYRNAASQLEIIVRKNPNDVRYWKQLALCYENLGQPDKLAEADVKIIALDKKDILSRERYSKYALEKKDQNTAYTIFKELASLKPKDQNVFDNLFQIALAKGEKDDATAFLKEYLALDSSRASYYKIFGELLFEAGKHEEALNAYRRSLKLDPQIRGLYKNYAAIVVKKRLDDEAIKVINSAIAAGEADAQMLVALGNIYKSKKQCVSAIPVYERALKLDPKNVAVLSNMGECQAEAGKVQDAIITLEQVVMLDQNAVEQYRLLGELKLKVNKKKEAMESYKLYLEKGVKNDDVAKKVGLYMFGSGSYKDAIKFLALVKDTTYHDAEYLTSIGTSYYREGDCEKAVEFYEKALAKKPTPTIANEILKPLGECYERAGNKMKAADAYEQYTRLPGIQDPEASYKKAFLKEQFDKATAISIYEENTKTYPRDYRNFLRLGMIYSENNSTLGQAAANLEKTAALVDTIAAVYQKLGSVYGRLGNTEKELVAYQKLVGMEPQNMEANKRIGILLLKKNTTQAIVHLETALTVAPKDPAIMVPLAQAYVMTNRQKEAVTLLVKAKELISEDPQLRLGLIRAYEAIGDKNAADKERDELAELDRKIISKDKNNVESRSRLAFYSLTKNELKTAYSLFNELAQLTPKDSSVFINLFTISLKQNDKKKAIEHLRQYLVLNPNNAAAHKDLGNLYYEQNDYDNALSEFRTALKLDPKIRGLYKPYADIVIKKNIEDEAIKVIEGAIEAKEADVGMYITLARIYEKRKLYPSAITMYQKALDQDPKNISLLVSVGQCQEKNGDIKNALLTYEQVVMLDPSAVAQFRSLGELHMKLNNRAAAIDAYKKYLEKATPKDEMIAKTIGIFEYEKKQYGEAIRYLELVNTPALVDENYLQIIGDSYYRTGNCPKTIDAYSRLWTSQKTPVQVLAAILKPLGECYEKTGKLDDAARAYDSYVKLPAVVDSEASYKRAFLREKSDRAEAIKLYQSNMVSFPKDYRNFLRLGLILSEDKETYSAAIQALEKTSVLIDTPIVWLKLGQLYGKQGNENKELLSYQKLLVKEPQNLEANRRAGILLLKNGQYSAAITNLETVLVLSPKDGEVMLKLADAYLKTKRSSQAIELLAKAKELNKNNADLLLQLYVLYKESGQMSKAEAEIKALIELKNDNKHRIMYANDLIEMKRYDEARTVADKVKAADPMNLDGLMLLARINRFQGKLDDAIEAYKMVLFANENFVPALYERAEVYLAKSDIEQAEKYFKKALQVDPKYARAEFGLALIAKKKNKSAEYIQHLEKARLLDPRDTEIAEEYKKVKK